MYPEADPNQEPVTCFTQLQNLPLNWHLIARWKGFHSLAYAPRRSWRRSVAEPCELSQDLKCSTKVKITLKGFFALFFKHLRPGNLGFVHEKRKKSYGSGHHLQNKLLTTVSYTKCCVRLIGSRVWAAWITVRIPLRRSMHFLFLPLTTAFFTSTFYLYTSISLFFIHLSCKLTKN